MRSLKDYLVKEYMTQDLNDKLMIDNRVISSNITLKDLKMRVGEAQCLMINLG